MRYLALYGLKFPPFRPDAPTEAFLTPPPVDVFLRRIELGMTDGGFSLLTGDPGTGKTIALRLLADRLRALPNVVVGTIEHPQSRTSDFYRELGRPLRRRSVRPQSLGRLQGPSRTLERPHRPDPSAARADPRRSSGGPDGGAQ